MAHSSQSFTQSYLTRDIFVKLSFSSVLHMSSIVSSFCTKLTQQEFSSCLPVCKHFLKLWLKELLKKETFFKRIFIYHSQIDLFCIQIIQHCGILHGSEERFFTCAVLSGRCVACYLILQKQSVLALTNHSTISFHHVPSGQIVEPLD